MPITLNWADAGVLVSILTTVFALVWGSNRMAFFAGAFLSEVKSIREGFVKFEKSFEEHMREESKQASAMWKKFDTNTGTLIEHEQRIGFLEKK